MTATNHALTGALIGLTIQNPLLALPAALLSHLLCDFIPHYGDPEPAAITSRKFARNLIIDAALCVLLVLVLFVTKPQNWLLACICAFVATSPDLLWIRTFINARKKVTHVPSVLEQFLGWIQWFQRPIGAYIELAWCLGAVLLLWQFL